VRVGGKIVIRDMQGVSDYQDCARLQQEIWVFPEGQAEIVPASCLVALHRYGGICLGAFDGLKMIGFVVGFLGTESGKLFLHSHMLAVLPTYRGRRVGAGLKWAQRDRALAQGLDRVNWTFDPLQAPNAHFNVNCLGAVAQKYIVDLYGVSDSPLHGGLPTDRFEAEWWIESERVRESKKGAPYEEEGWERLPRVNPTGDLGSGLRRCEDALRLDLEDDAILVEIPANLTAMMARERELALDWRMKTRRVFGRYLPRYRVEGFHRADERFYYRLARTVPTDRG
jgi:predicted GNAT superfamily acetyltransferase